MLQICQPKAGTEAVAMLHILSLGMPGPFEWLIISTIMLLILWPRIPEDLRKAALVGFVVLCVVLFALAQHG